MRSISSTTVSVLLAVIVSACSSTSGQGGPGDGGASGWPVQFGLPMDAGSAGVRDIDTDAMGNVYVAGQDTNNNSIVWKFDPTGRELWAKSYTQEDCDGIAVDPAHGGAIYLATTKVGPPLSAPEIVKLDLNGSLQWTKDLTPTQVMAPTQTTGGAGVGVAVDPSGDVILGGICDSAIMGVMPAKPGESDLFLAKLDPTGAVQWVTMLGTGTGQNATNIVGLTTDAMGSIYLASEASDTIAGQPFAGGTGDVLLAKFDTTGKTTWVREDGTSGEDAAYDLAVDASGNAYVAGFSTGALDGQTNAGMRDAVLLKYDAMGNRVWTREIGSPFDDDGLGVGLDPQGLPVLGGVSFGDFDGHTNKSPSNSGGNQNAIVVKYDASGTKQWSNEDGTDNGDNVAASATDAKGNTFVTATTDSTLVGMNMAPVYVIRFVPTGQAQ